MGLNGLFVLNILRGLKLLKASLSHCVVAVVTHIKRLNVYPTRDIYCDMDHFIPSLSIVDMHWMEIGIYFIYLASCLRKLVYSSSLSN